MTETAWVNLTRPHRMLRHVEAVATERRLRLLMVACHRWSFPFQGTAYDAVLQAVERAADGIESAEDMLMLNTLPAWERRVWHGSSGQAVTVALMEGQFPLHRSNESERVAQCNLIRDIFGNPFRPVVADPTWLTPTVQSIASAIYQERAFDRLPILADALEEAGCTNSDVLLHCRQPGEHVRGCWVVDLVLGKE